MNKSILVIDTPKGCGYCPLNEFVLDEGLNEWFFRCYLMDMSVDDDEKIPSWCPLRPLPQKGTMENVVKCEYNRGFVDGRNNCIDLITGETE